MKIGMIFAGQGSQYVGMGQEFYNAFPAQYLKIQVEKGIISFDDILRLIDRYKEYL